MLDHASVFSTMKRILAQKRAVKGWRRLFDPVKIIGAVLGTVLLLSIYAASKAEIPLLNLGHIGVLGAFLGLLAAAFCEKFSPVDVNEMMAGQALGLPYVQIMREIVIPSGRPGLMYMLNRRRQRFK